MNNLDALQMAMKTLNGSGLKLWLYLNKNQDGYRFELSRVDCANWGIKKDSYYKAVEELIQKGLIKELSTALFVEENASQTAEISVEKRSFEKVMD